MDDISGRTLKKISGNRDLKKTSYFRTNWDLYAMIAPGMLFFVIFFYLPMFGLLIAFQDYSVGGGFFASDWVGLKQFEKMFKAPLFYNLLRNTLLINVYKLVFAFPFPIMVAIMINEIKQKWFRKTAQTVTYLPYFLSWVVIGGILIDTLSMNTGIINHFIKALGGEAVPFLINKSGFRSILVISDIWKNAGWGSIIYLASITNINPELFEAAKIDGANRFQQIRFITIPSIVSTIIIVLLLNLGSILTNSFEQILMIYSPPVYDVADIIGTYVYRVGLADMRYSYTTAVGLFQSLVGFILVVSANYIARRKGEVSIW